MDPTPEVLETIEDGIATLTFNRPERMNALSTPIMEGLLHGLPRLAGDPSIKVVVLTGASDKPRRTHSAADLRGHRGDQRRPRTPGMKGELLALEAHKQELVAKVKQAQHRDLAFTRQRVDRLHEELNRPELRSEAAQALRGLIDEVRLMPENRRLEIALLGDMTGILALSTGDKGPATHGRDGL